MIPSHIEATFPQRTTTDSYALLGSAWNKAGYSIATVVVHNNGTPNGCTYKLEGSLDGSTWFAIGSPGNIAAGANAKVDISAYYPWIRIYVKAQVDTDQTTVQAFAAAISP